jgi:hypothetical protein
MATLKSIPKAKVWYKSIKVGDKLLIQLHPKHIWYSNVRDKQLIAVVQTVHHDGTFCTVTEESIVPAFNHHLVLIGPAGTDWEDSYPATIIKKIKQPIE